MTNLSLASLLLGASALSFGLIFLALRRPNAGRWTDNDTLVSLICVALTGLLSMSIASFVAFGLTAAEELAALGSAKVLGLGLGNLAALVLMTSFVRRGGQLAARAATAAVVVPFTPGAPQPPANNPKRPKLRRAA